MKPILFYIQLLFLLIAFNGSLLAQEITKMDVGINGLTCSQCSKSVEMQLKKLPFIQSIDMDLLNTQATITIKKMGRIDLYAIPNAIKDAGFSIRSLDLYFDVSPFDKKMCTNSRNLQLGVPSLTNDKVLRVWNPLFVSKRVFKEHKINKSDCCSNYCILLIPIND